MPDPQTSAPGAPGGPSVGRFRKMLLSGDGGYSIVKLAKFSGYVVVTSLLIAIFCGLAFLGWDWADWQGFVITAASILVGGSVVDNASHRMTYQPEAEAKDR